MKNVNGPGNRVRAPVGAAVIIEEGVALDDTTAPIVQRPDGWYWEAPDGRQVFGPFASASLARLDRDRIDEAAPVPGESLAEAESAMDIADWIDPETGVPAEGQCLPHLPED